jgi:hypothetical protein
MPRTIACKEIVGGARAGPPESTESQGRYARPEWAQTKQSASSPASRRLPYRALTVTGPARQRVFFDFASCLAPPSTASIYTSSVQNVSEHEPIMRPVHDIILSGNLKDLHFV